MAGKDAVHRAHGLASSAKPLITVAAHEDMTAADLAGRYLLEPAGNGSGTTGPFDTGGAETAPICYLDEIVEAPGQEYHRRHPSAYPTPRRILPLERNTNRDRCPRNPDFPADDFLQPRLSKLRSRI